MKDTDIISVIEHKGHKAIFVVDEHNKISLSEIPINTHFFDTCEESIDAFKKIIDGQTNGQ